MNPIRQELLRRRGLHRAGAFESSRLYVPGDDASRIDWRLTARTREIHVRQRARDVPLWFSELVDRSASMLAGRGRSLSQAAAEAVRVWHDAMSSDDRFIELAPAASFQASLDNAARLPFGTCLLVIGDFLDVDTVAAAFMRLCRRLDCTVLVARDPWRDALPLAGFVYVADLETRKTQRYFIGKRERSRYHQHAALREAQVLSEVRAASCRAGLLNEGDGARSLRQVFGLA
ncbi:MAG TPA: DUF58 domain-containing protein [Candidatus Rubrimentiphilum sp.]|nr:DUF58 domain-containing protein [Candidatus Rubrimentiphilum sp.]